MLINKCNECSNLDKNKFIKRCNTYTFFTHEFCPINPPVSQCCHVDDNQHCNRCIYKWNKNGNSNINKKYTHMLITDDSELS